MSRLSKKELESLAKQYKYLPMQEDLQERFQGLKTTLQIIGQLTNVKNQVFLMDNPYLEMQVNTVKTLVEKAESKHKFDLELLSDYLDNASFYQKLDHEEKRLLKHNIVFIQERAK